LFITTITSKATLPRLTATAIVTAQEAVSDFQYDYDPRYGDDSWQTVEGSYDSVLHRIPLAITMPVYELPTRNDVSAPRFDEDSPRGLVSYFEELEYLFERHRISDPAQRKQSAVRYVSVDVRELWQCAVAWDDPTRSYEDFKAEVHAFYPEASIAFRYTTWDLGVLVNVRAQHEIQSVEDLGAFYRKFITISTFLVKSGRLSILEQAKWFLAAFSGKQATHLRQRHELKYPSVHIDDTPHLGDIFEAAQFVLLQQLYSAHATGATVPGTPRHPEKQNATKARAPIGAAPVLSSLTPPTASSVILVPAAAPLMSDAALELCQKGSIFSTAMLAAPPTSRAANGPLSDHSAMVKRTISQGDTSPDHMRRKRGEDDSNHTTVVGNAGPAAPISIMDPPMESVVPLQISENRWVAISTSPNASLDGESSGMVERQVKTLLNELTTEHFDSISDQIIAWANKSEKEKDGRTLIQVIEVIFESATNDVMFSEMYARLCHKMMEQVSPKVQDHSILDAKGKPVAGGRLFRKYLVGRCREEFERGWLNRATTADQAIKEANEKDKAGEVSELHSEEYYAADKARHRRLGLVRFIGELFKLQMLTEHIMHECIKKCLANVENPGEDEIESLAILLTTVGGLLDTRKARGHLDVYFSRMQEWTKNKNVNVRMVFMLQVRANVTLCLQQILTRQLRT
jgi:hypothetical protein